MQLARQARPPEVATAGARYLAYLRPDGTLDSDEQQDRARELLLRPRPDGSYDLKGRLTPACGAQLLATLSPRSAPRPANGGELDPRSHRQRLHDALEELAGLAVRRGELTRSGAAATVIISMTTQQYRTRHDLVHTCFGQPLTVQQALDLADEAALIGLVRAATGAVLKLGLTERTASRNQSPARYARDKGCSFPDCDQPPDHCQRHHVPPRRLARPPTETPAKPPNNPGHLTNQIRSPNREGQTIVASRRARFSSADRAM